jgi:hypothetical protein
MGSIFIMEKLSELQAVKDRFGGFTFLDLTAYDLQTAHWHLGMHVRQQVHKILSQRLERLDISLRTLLFQQSHHCAETLTEKLADQRLDSRLHVALQEYMNCLAAWIDGAGLMDFTHPTLAAYSPVSPLDLALFLQHDSTGCQTGMYRQEDGSVILWHTEEDIEFEDGSGFDQLRLAAFNVGEGGSQTTMHAFIYPDLLPGPAFGWRSDGYAQAVDTLHIKLLPSQKDGILANIATWLTLWMGPACDPAEVVKAMCPYFDGYALNTLSVRNDKVRAEKFEFARDKIIPSTLDEQPGSYLFQVNIFSQKDHPWVKELEQISSLDHRLYGRRIERTQRAMQNKDHRYRGSGEMDFFFNLFTSRTGNGWAYANTNMKAYFILRQTIQEAEIWLGHGPALPNDLVSVIRIPLA